MHSGVFITGTDTGIGKTMVACAIAAAARQRDLRVGVFKPVETGCRREGESLIAADAERLIAAAGCVQQLEQATGASFEKPAAPLAAAIASDSEISADNLTEKAGDLIDTYDFTVVEGAGGLLVPIADGITWLDLAEEFDLPVLCVVGDRLGCINHALLTLDRLEHEGLEICGFVMNRMQAAESTTRGKTCNEVDGDQSGDFELTDRSSNLSLIAHFSDQACLGEFPYVPERDREDFAKLAEYAEQALDLDAILGRPSEVST